MELCLEWEEAEMEVDNMEVLIPLTLMRVAMMMTVIMMMMTMTTTRAVITMTILLE